MSRFQVVWAHAASADLGEIISYVAIDSPGAAEKILEKLESRAGTLERYPRRGRVVPELARLQIRSYRELVVPPYRLMYRIAGKIVFVLGVFDGRQDLSEVLLQRLLREG